MPTNPDEMSDSQQGEMPDQQQSSVSPGPNGETADEAWDPDRARALIGRLRSELKQQCKELKDLEQQRKQDKMSESERQAQQIKTLEADLQGARHERQEALNRSAAIIAAQKAGAVDPDAVVRLLSWDTLDYAPDGTPKDVDQAVAALLAEKKYLVGQQAPVHLATTNGATRTASPAAETRVFTRAEINDYKFFMANRDSIQLALKQGRVRD